jgi:putative transposase
LKPSPSAFVVQAVRSFLGETDTILRHGRILLYDRDPTWTAAMEAVLSTVDVRVVRTPPASPNCNAHAERFVRSIKEECLDRVVPLGEWHLRRLVRAYVTHYHAERNHQGIGNALIDRPPPQPAAGPIRRRQRVGGILSYYYRAA